MDISLVTVVVFCALIVITFLKNVLYKYDREQFYKIIGGLSVFLVAIISKNAWVIAISLFIGGLIVASEDFLQKLAIIFRSKSEDIADNLKITKPSSDEIHLKRKREIQETVESTEESLSKTRTDKKTIISKYEDFENRIAKYLEEYFGASFLPNIKFTNAEGNMWISDGVIRLPNNKITTIVETKFVKHPSGLIASIQHAISSIRKVVADKSILICIGSDSERTEEYLETINFIESIRSEYENVDFMLFKYTSKGLSIMYQSGKKDVLE